MVAQLQAGASAVRFDPNGFANPSAVSGPTVRQQLRQATSEAHEALHVHPSFVSLLEGRITLPAYRVLLARLHGFHWSLDHGLREASPRVLGGLNVPTRERSPALRSDLRALGMTESEIDGLPVCEALPAIRSHAELMGRLYVVEGSALGGRVMAARLEGILRQDSTVGRQFFTGRAAPDPLPWAVFCRLLEASKKSEIPAVVKSAQTTFRVLAEWLTESETHV